MPGIMLLPVIPVYADGTADAKDVVSASLDNTVIRNAAESLVMNTLLLEIRGIIVIATDHHNPIVRLAQPLGIAIVHIVIVSRLVEPETAVPISLLVVPYKYSTKIIICIKFVQMLGNYIDDCPGLVLD